MRPAHEFSHPVAVDTIPPQGLSITLNAPPDVCAAVAARLGFLSLTTLEGALNITYHEPPVVEVTGTLRATLTQACIVTLDPVPETVNERVHGLFMPAAMAQDFDEGESADDALVRAPSIDIIDAGGRIDLGEFLVQNLALCCTPYPRTEGASLPAPSEDTARVTPFTRLQTMIPPQQPETSHE